MSVMIPIIAKDEEPDSEPLKPSPYQKLNDERLLDSERELGAEQRVIGIFFEF